MNKFRGVRPFLLLGLLLGLGSHVAAAASPPAPVVKGLHAAPISAHQWCVLDLARDAIAGTGLELTFQAIVLQESSAGEQLVNHKDPSYGAAGMKLDTAQMLAQDTSITAGDLVSDTVLNLKLGSAMLQICRLGFASSWKRTVACYNHGGAGAKAMTDAAIAADAYVLAITRRLHQVQRFRRHTDTCPRD